MVSAQLSKTSNELKMKRNTLSIPGYPNCHANPIFVGQDSGAITHSAMMGLICKKGCSISFREA